jgi:hypothetical protein
MSEPIDPTTTTPAQPLSLVSRIIGVITSPKATFQNIVAAPRPVGILFVCALLVGVCQLIPQTTETGRKAVLEQQVKMIERFGQTVTPEAYQRMEERLKSPINWALQIVGVLIVTPIISLLFGAIYWAIFNTVLGGTATFKQVLAIVTHSQVIQVLGMIAALPIQLARGTMSYAGPFNLGALVPMLDPESGLARYLSSISVFGIWGSIVTGIGLGVLYKRSGRNISIALVIVYLLFMLAVTSVLSSFMGGRA